MANYVYQIWNEDMNDEYVKTSHQLSESEIYALSNILKSLANDERFEDYGIEDLTAEACELFNARFDGANLEVTDMPFITSISF